MKNLTQLEANCVSSARQRNPTVMSGYTRYQYIQNGRRNWYSTIRNHDFETRNSKTCYSAVCLGLLLLMWKLRMLQPFGFQGNGSAGQGFLRWQQGVSNEYHSSFSDIVFAPWSVYFGRELSNASFSHSLIHHERRRSNMVYPGNVLEEPVSPEVKLVIGEDWTKSTKPSSFFGLKSFSSGLATEKASLLHGDLEFEFVLSRGFRDFFSRAYRICLTAIVFLLCSYGLISISLDTFVSSRGKLRWPPAEVIIWCSCWLFGSRAKVHQCRTRCSFTIVLLAIGMMLANVNATLQATLRCEQSYGHVLKHGLGSWSGLVDV